jgi:outer membrane protein assembly factor BamB
MTWLRSTTALFVSILLLPPLGLVLLWMRPARAWKKVAGSLAIALVGVVHLVLVYGMRMELRGNGMTPVFTFRSKDRHYADLEQSRARQAKEAPSVAATAAPEPLPVEAKSDAAPSAPAVSETPAPSAYWTTFRGPKQDGVYSQGPILTEWPSTGLERLWKQPIGGGYSSFVMGEGRAYTNEQRRDKEFVVAYDLRTGREMWTHSYPAFFQESMGGDGPRATPAYHAGFVYSLGATGELRALKASNGAVQWSKNILTENNASNIQWGMSSAPLIVDQMLIVQPGGSSNNSIVAYDRLSGKLVWSALDDRQAYTSPMLVTLAGKRQILTVTAKRVVGLEPASGKLLWEHPWVTEFDVNSSQPLIVNGNQFLISAGYGHGSALVEVSANSDSFSTKTIWQNNRLKNRFNSSVLHDGYAYGLDENILQCIRVSDGQQMWKGGRYGYGQLLSASGHLVVLTETGEVVLVKATPDKHTELAKFDAIEGKTWNVPAIESGLLVIRNNSEMACFRIGK